MRRYSTMAMIRIVIAGKCNGVYTVYVTKPICKKQLGRSKHNKLVFYINKFSDDFIPFIKPQNNQWCLVFNNSGECISHPPGKYKHFKRNAWMVYV